MIGGIRLDHVGADDAVAAGRMIRRGRIVAVRVPVPCVAHARAWVVVIS